MKARSIIAVIAEDKRFTTQVKKPLAGILTGALGFKGGLLGGNNELRSENPGPAGCAFHPGRQNQALNTMRDTTVISGGC